MNTDYLTALPWQDDGAARGLDYAPRRTMHASKKSRAKRMSTAGGLVWRALDGSRCGLPPSLWKAEWLKRASETCGIADMVALAISLTDAGISDYWMTWTTTPEFN
jgi:hypothetical protein